MFGGIQLPRVTYIEPEDVKDLILDNINNENKRYSIIDVRDEDWSGGNIRGSINVPSEQFGNDENIDELINSLIEKNINHVIFHCMQSQVRGPACASRFLGRVTCIIDDEEKYPNVQILSGGYNQWRRLYGNNSNLIENI